PISPPSSAAAPTVGIPSLGSASPRPPRRLVLIVMENRNFDRIIGDGCCPYVNSLARRGVLFTRWYGIRYPSLPNYLAMAGGSTFGRSTDDTSPLVGGPNLFDQLTAARVPWGVFEESMPRPCFRDAFASGNGGTYALKHDPAMLLADVSGS